ncbi:aurora kinase A- and ninein-interacting protein isoform X2 [Pyxicephalus adspersus]|uniref:aurora kinase A- and ninein-interacting protein isoform X2 n=1 Tax=Pyxicephalus adspersus TaxID=30357 RepID=UPI003B5CC6B6
MHYRTMSPYAVKLKRMGGNAFLANQQTLISSKLTKRFNPLLRRQHIDSATFEFTQTKTPQLCTKQTSMFAFFTPKGKKAAKPANQENTPSSLCVSGKAEENDTEPLNIGSSGSCADEASSCENTLFNPQTNTQESAQKEIYKEYINVTDSLVHPKDHLQSNSVRTETIICYSTNFSTSCTTKQHSVSLFDSSISSHYPEMLYKDLYTESQLDSQLFTQDSQGNRVIAHGSTSDKQKTRYPSGPLQDRTNALWGTVSPMKRSRQYRCDEDSLNCLFTQDSEGNMVIKH